MTETLIETPPPMTDRESELEDRIRRLEAALAEKNPPADDDAVAERVIARLSAIAESRSADPNRVLVLDAAAGTLATTLPPPPSGAVLEPPQSPVDPLNRRWFLTQLWAEIRLIFRMYFDPRYRVSRLTQFALPGIAVLLVLNYFFFSWVSIPVVSPVTERLAVAVLGVLAYKLLTRETARYRGVLEYLARYGQR